MAAHGRTGEAYWTYIRRKQKAHRVSGVYTDEGDKRVRFNRNDRKRTLRRRSATRGKREFPLYRPFVCSGRSQLS